MNQDMTDIADTANVTCRACLTAFASPRTMQVLGTCID
jgi:hypothetical protein